MEGPIPCFVAGDKGYVWDANGAMRLRKKHRIMGCLVGNVTQFKNQNEVNYLPLELSADEVTLAARQGWIELFPETAAPVRTVAMCASTATTASRARVGAGVQAGRGVDSHGDWDDAYHEYYSQFDPLRGFAGPFLPLLGPKRRRLAQQLPASRQRLGTGGQPPAVVEGLMTSAADVLGGVDVSPDGGASGLAPDGAGDTDRTARGHEAAQATEGQTVLAADCAAPGWRAVLADGGSYTLPLTAAKAAAGRAGADTEAGAGRRPESSGEAVAATEQPLQAAAGRENQAAGQAEEAGAANAEAEADAGIGRVEWKYPSTPVERLRFDVFLDLHRQGFIMTGGIKFGSDLLAYPGDPSLYHAQFTVRPVAPGEALNPMVLKAAARGSHAARKHMLLAFYADGTERAPRGQQLLPRIHYMSFAPEAGFGSKA